MLRQQHNCWGEPHDLCVKWSIPIIVVKENNTALDEVEYPEGCIFVENYLEATGVVSALKSGIALESLSRPLGATKIL